MAARPPKAKAIKIPPVTASTPNKTTPHPPTLPQRKIKAGKPARPADIPVAPTKIYRDKDPVLEVTATGTLIGARAARPIVAKPSSAPNVVNNALCRNIIDSGGKPQREVSPTLRGMQEVVKSYATGADLTKIKEHIQLVAANQVEKEELFNAYRTQLDREEATILIGVGHSAVQQLEHISQRGDLSTLELISIWRLSNDRLAQIDQRTAAAAAKPIEGAGLTEKLNYAKNKQEEAVANFWEGTTPQGREVIRKHVYRATIDRDKAEAEAAKTAAPPPPEVEPSAEELAAQEEAPPTISVTLAHPQ